MTTTSSTIEVCFSPKLLKYIRTREECIVVVTDILRASTSICSALEHGALKVMPVATLQEAMKLKEKGMLVAAERNGVKVDFADFGNSPFEFTAKKLKGRILVYTTTNGTRAIEMAREVGTVAIGGFVNRQALSRWILRQDKPVVILCAGWKNQFNLEDAVFCGAMIESLIAQRRYRIDCDSSAAAMDLWSVAKHNLLRYIEKASHRERLKQLGADDVLAHAFTPDISDVVPVLNGEYISDVSRII
ncbi:MAG: 2-phosphosulfolactate phosphatase [Bacteroidales bacterium]|nr:2-phosphosulfolactate phosphatase [Lentimicrobiaceae bacterium]MDD5694014.1 2-phosphosulfolactate phosphatase [Bacteroidales bacterium]